MFFPLGLLLIIVGILVAQRRTRPVWWAGVVFILIGLGLIWSVLTIVGVTQNLGFTATSWIGWIYLALSLITMLAAIFVLERRGPNGEEQDALIGDTIFDGDTNDADDPDVVGTTAAPPTPADSATSTTSTPDVTTDTDAAGPPPRP